MYLRKIDLMKLKFAFFKMQYIIWKKHAQRKISRNGPIYKLLKGKICIYL